MEGAHQENKALANMTIKAVDSYLESEAVCNFKRVTISIRNKLKIKYHN